MKSEQSESIRPYSCVEIRKHMLNGLRYEELDNKYKFELKQILKHAFGYCDCNVSEKPVDVNKVKPYKNRYVLEKLAIDDGMRYTEVGNLLNCHQETVAYYVDHFDLDPIENGNRTSSKMANTLQRIGAEGDIEIK